MASKKTAPVHFLIWNGYAIEILDQGGDKAYDKAISVLDEYARDWWEDSLQDSTPLEQYEDDRTGLKEFLENEVLDWYEKRRKEIEFAPLIKSQALGEAFNPGSLTNLARYETHLDRKFERTLAMLLKLQSLRHTVIDLSSCWFIRWMAGRMP